MIIARAPLRVSLAGGGTDLPWFQAAGGEPLIVAASIDRYVRVAVNRRHDGRIRVAYSKDEIVDDAADIEHPLLRGMLRGRRGLELHSMADIPANSGLGSSGAFCVAVLAALDRLDDCPDDPGSLAANACAAEQGVNPHTGWQDHAVATHGGVRRYTDARRGGSVSVAGLDTLTLWDTGSRRAAHDVLAEQAKRPDVDGARRVRFLAEQVARGMHIGDALAAHWQIKRLSQPADLAKRIDSLDCRGAKLVGAGGGGFVLVSEAGPRLAGQMRDFGWTELKVRFGVSGVEVLRW